MSGLAAAMMAVVLVTVPQQRSVRPAQAPAAPPLTGVAERVTLRSGKVVWGEVQNDTERNKLIVIVRRAWAESELPELARSWTEYERPWLKRASDERLARLEEWKDARTRLSHAAANDSLVAALGQEISRLKDDPRPSRLMMATIDRREVARVDRQTPVNLRLLHLGWRAGFSDVETREADDLKSALEGRNFPVGETTPVPIDDLLPLPIESDRQWRLRRAATEVKQDRAGWFVRFNDMILPDSGTGQALDLNALGGAGGLAGLAGLSGLGDISKLLGELNGDAPAAPVRDPLMSKLATLAGTGRVGAVVTRLTLAPDLSGVTVESELWVNAGPGPDQWTSAGKRVAQVNTDQVAAGAGANLEADPQIKQAFALVEGLGLGGISGEMKQRALAMGAATQTALGQVRTAANEDLERLALPLGETAP